MSTDPTPKTVPEELADQELYQKVLARMADKPNAIEVDLDDL